MKSRAMVLGLLFSVTVNLVLVAALAARLLLAARREAPPGQPLCQRLALSGWQVEAMDSSRHCFAIETGGVCAALHQERQRLLDALSAEQPDAQAIAMCMQRIDSLQSILQRRAVESILRERKILSPEQAAAYLNLIKERLRVETPCTQLQEPHASSVKECPVLQNECPNQRR